MCLIQGDKGALTGRAVVSGWGGGPRRGQLEGFDDCGSPGLAGGGRPSLSVRQLSAGQLALK